MLKANDILKDILGCGYMELDMLFNSNIDVYSTIETLKEKEYEIDMGNILRTAFTDKVYDLFYDKDGWDSWDFEIDYNGIATRIILKRYSFYQENYPDEIKELEEYMGMELYEGVHL